MGPNPQPPQARYPERLRAAVAPFLQGWWSSQEQFPSKRQFARTAEITRSQLEGYFTGGIFPTGERYEKLRRLTGLPHFCPDGVEFPSWAEELLAKGEGYIRGLPVKAETKRKLGDYFFSILGNLIQARISSPDAITPQRLIRNAPAYGTVNHALSSFARFLVASGLWGGSQEQDLSNVLEKLYKDTKPRSRKEAPPSRVPPVAELVVNCGLSIKEIQTLRMSQITPEGICLTRGRSISFGEGGHRISRGSFDGWLAEAEPRDFIFYQRSPRDYHKPVGYLWLLRACGVKPGRRRPVERAHFDHEARDYLHFKNLRHTRLHWMHFHGMSLDASWVLGRRLARSAKTFIVPEPYLLAAICASRLLPCSVKVLEGGKRCRAIFQHSLLGRYDVTVSWPVRFAQELAHRQKAERVARLLYAMGRAFWIGRLCLRGGPPIPKEAADLLRSLAKTEIQVRDANSGLSWGGAIFRRSPGLVRPAGRLKSDGILKAHHSRDPHFRIPLIEDLEGGVVDSWCKVCQHSQLDQIDAELRAALRSGKFHKGFRGISRKYGIGYKQLRRHAGTLTKVQPSHVSPATAARKAGCPNKFVQSLGSLDAVELVLYTVLVSEQARTNSREFIVSPSLVRERIGIELTNHQLSLALNRLTQDPLKLVTIRSSTPTGIPVSLQL